MTEEVAHVAVLGSTGSIGRSTLDVIEASSGRLRGTALSAHANLDQLVQQAQRSGARWVVAADPVAAAAKDWSDLPRGVELLVGPEGLETVASHPEIDVVVAAIVGSAGIARHLGRGRGRQDSGLGEQRNNGRGRTAGDSVARRRSANIVPVDSEHSAVFQALQAGRRHEVRRIILTASGGPFRNYSEQQLAEVTIDDALRHPTWSMGPKITIDSATLMNKALEIIEARWLFDLEPEQIDVVIHPQSIVHSMVEFVDGSVIAQLSTPDMKLPIQYALNYPHRRPGVAARLDFTEQMRLDFEPADPQRFPALALGLEVARAGGTAGAVLNAANEAAVAEFRAGKLRFTDIVPRCRAILDQHEFDPNPSLAQLLAIDAWARQEVVRWACI